MTDDNDEYMNDKSDYALAIGDDRNTDRMNKAEEARFRARRNELSAREITRHERFDERDVEGAIRNINGNDAYSMDNRL